MVPNDHLRSIISAAQSASVDAPDHGETPAPRTELDSHANMVVLGRHCFIFDNIHENTCEVQPFDPTLGSAKNVPIVDALVAYDCPYTFTTYMLVFRNALYVPSMQTNLVPPFILREAGLVVNDTAKIHLKDPTV